MARPKRKASYRPGLSPKLQECRETWGFTEQELADILDCTRALIVKYEGRMKGQEHCIPPVDYIRRFNQFRRELRKERGTDRVLIVGNRTKHVIVDMRVVQNNSTVRECKRLRCKGGFIAVVHNQVFCSTTCRKRSYRGV